MINNTRPHLRNSCLEGGKKCGDREQGGKALAGGRELHPVF